MPQPKQRLSWPGVPRGGRGSWAPPPLSPTFIVSSVLAPAYMRSSPHYSEGEDRADTDPDSDPKADPSLSPFSPPRSCSPALFPPPTPLPASLSLLFLELNMPGVLYTAEIVHLLFPLLRMLFPQKSTCSLPHLCQDSDQMSQYQRILTRAPHIK